MALPAIPAFAAVIIVILIEVTKHVVSRVLIALGVGFVVYKGADLGLDALKVRVVDSLAGLPEQTLAVMSALQIGKALAVILAALALRAAYDGLTGNRKEMEFK